MNCARYCLDRGSPVRFYIPKVSMVMMWLPQTEEVARPGLQYICNPLQRDSAYCRLCLLPCTQYQVPHTNARNLADLGPGFPPSRRQHALLKHARHVPIHWSLPCASSTRRMLGLQLSSPVCMSCSDSPGHLCTVPSAYTLKVVPRPVSRV